MPNYICLTCGIQYTETDAPPAHCLICADDRPDIGHKGRQWTTIAGMPHNQEVVKYGRPF